MKPLSENLVFVDTEFTDLKATADLLSIGLVKLDGSSLYLEIETDAPVSDFVIENVLPHFDGNAVSKEEAMRQMRAFLGDESPYMVCWVPHYDMVLLTEFFGVNNLPVHWHPIDFASILFGAGVDPELYRTSSDYTFARELGVNPDDYRLHHALDDARFLKDVWVKYKG